MNVNISTGSKSKVKQKDTAKQTTGATATGKSAVSKVGKVVGTIGKFAEKYGGLIPGVGGIVSTIGKVASSLNDPEWWMNVPGTGVSTNVPLQTQSEVLTGETNAGTYATVRPGILEFSIVEAINSTSYPGCITPSEDMISTYLMQEVRKVLNAVPMQDVNAYRDVFTNGATAYALKKQLDKMLYLTEHSKPFLPSLTDGSFPALSAANHATLVACRDTLKEYIKASVRLPHTLCQYLTWRFGRIFRTGESEKAAIVVYNVIPLHTKITPITELVSRITGFAASSASYYGYTYTGSEKARALADLYNAYIDHVMDLEISDADHYMYDRKEFVLRTNLDIGRSEWHLGREAIYMDSTLDNKTTFMASTVSTNYVDTNGETVEALFPVGHVNAYAVNGPDSAGYFVVTAGAGGSWTVLDAGPGRLEADITPDNAGFGMFMGKVAACKALELYNAEIYAPAIKAGKTSWIDMTAPSTDMGYIERSVLKNTHMYAFANLVFAQVKSYAAKEMPKAIKASEQVLTDVAAASSARPDALPTASAVNAAMKSDII